MKVKILKKLIIIPKKKKLKIKNFLSFKSKAKLNLLSFCLFLITLILYPLIKYFCIGFGLTL